MKRGGLDKDEMFILRRLLYGPRQFPSNYFPLKVLQQAGLVTPVHEQWGTVTYEITEEGKRKVS